NPPRTRVQEVASGIDGQRVFVIDSDERRQYEQGKRQQALERTRVKLLSVQRRVAEGELTDPARIGAAAERALRAQQGDRYGGCGAMCSWRCWACCCKRCCNVAWRKRASS